MTRILTEVRRKQLEKELYAILEIGAYNGYGISQHLRERAKEITDILGRSYENEVNFELGVINGQ